MTNKQAGLQVALSIMRLFR